MFKMDFRQVIGLTMVVLSYACNSQSKPGGIAGRTFDERVIVKPDQPVYYDLRNRNRLSPVRTQPAGGCWASAVMSSVESSWRSQKYSQEILSDVNLLLYHGYDPGRNGYGNHFMATAYLTRGSGPVIQNPATDSLQYTLTPFPELNIEACYLPDSASLIKQTIMDFGSVWSMMYFRKELFDTTSNIWYTPVKKINHVVNLVGWNDTLQSKEGRGCWIAQNSLGNKFGENGFFYIPYSDPNILEYNAVWTYWMSWDDGNQLYYYDTLGSTERYGFDDTVCYGLVKFTATDNIRIHRIGTPISLAQTEIRAELYLEFDTTAKILSGPLSTTASRHCRFAGYYSVELTNPVVIKENSDFYVLMQYSHPVDTMLLPVERFVKDYADPDITTGKCWVNPDLKKYPNTWYPCGEASPYPGLLFDLCIRVYAVDVE